MVIRPAKPRPSGLSHRAKLSMAELIQRWCGVARAFAFRIGAPSVTLSSVRLGWFTA
jgi:hypothetical protein